MKIKCLIVDDEPLAIKVLEKYIQDIDSLELVGSCRSATKALTYVTSQAIDVVFLDIQMPQLTGMAFAKSLQRPPKIIFTTAYREFAAESYEVNAIDYLVKPISFERFFQAIQKLQLALNTASMPLVTDAPEMTDNTLLIKADKKQHVVKLEDIQYIESVKDYVIVHTPEQNLVSYQSLTQVEASLPSDTFLRIHRSFVVNLYHIKAFNATSIVLPDTEVHIGRTYKDEVEQKLNAFFS